MLLFQIIPFAYDQNKHNRPFYLSQRFSRGSLHEITQTTHVIYLYCLVFQSNVSDYDEELSRGMIPMERISHGTAI